MKPSLQPMNPPRDSKTDCGVLRHQYADVGKSQEFIQEIQSSYDALASYVNTTLETDLAEVRKESDPGTMMRSLVRYVRIEKLNTAQPDYLLFNQVAVYERQTNNNVALNKATQSSSVYSVEYGAGNAVNGKIQDQYNHFISNYENSASWEVDLNNPVQVSRILFYNTAWTSWQANMTKYKLKVLNSSRELISEYPFTANAVQEFTVSYPTSKRELINQKMTDLAAVEKKLQSAMKCLDLEVNQRQSISSEIYSLQNSVKEKEKVVDTKHTNVRAAKERAHLLRDPYSEVTIWESWFPLQRPLEKYSVPVLWFFSIVFLILSIGLFLQLVGFKLDIGGRLQQATTAAQSSVSRLRDLLPKGGPKATAPAAKNIGNLNLGDPK